jgi:hypothetical protein
MLVKLVENLRGVMGVIDIDIVEIYMTVTQAGAISAGPMTLRR